MKKTAPVAAAKRRRTYTADAYDYHDDVTKEAVDKVRAKAAAQLNKADLELVDGVEQYAI